MFEQRLLTIKFCQYFYNILKSDLKKNIFLLEFTELVKILWLHGYKKKYLKSQTDKGEPAFLCLHSTVISCYGKFIPNTTAKLNEKFKKVTYYYLYYKGHF